MAVHRESPVAQVNPLIVGHFREKSGYAVWRTRGSPDWLLIQTIHGEGRFGFEAGQCIVHEGDLVLVMPGTLHDYGVNEITPGASPHPGRGAAGAVLWELMWTHFHPRAHWHEWLAWPAIATGLMRLTPPPGRARQAIARRFADVHRLANGSLRRRTDFAMNALEELLLRCDLHNPSNEQAAIDTRVRAAMDFMCTQLSRKIMLDDVAAASGLSVSRLAHLFRRQVGTTPQRFLEMQRLERARQLLEVTERSVKEIAYAVGFDSPFYFTLRFKHNSGVSPREYRKRSAAR